MNPSEVFIKRPVATTLLTFGIALAGMISFFFLPVSPMPQIDQATINVSASMAGASPETMANSVATPLERHLGQIADVTEMTSSSSIGNTRITLQFGLNRDIEGAARDVQAAINAARADLPVSLKANPTYRKSNPSDRPIVVLSLVSKVLTPGEMYDSAATVLQQKLSQVEGVGQVSVSGSSLPAVRVELNPTALFKYGIGPESVRAALSAANANAPKGAIEENGQRFQIYVNDQSRKAEQYESLVIGYRNGNPIRLHDVSEVSDSVEDLRNQGIANGDPAVLVFVNREPGANIIATVDRIKALIPGLRVSIPAGIDLEIANDRTKTIRASLHDVERTLLMAIALVVLVVFLFLRDPRASLIPCVAVPVSLIGTFAAMLLLGYSLDNLSLMALTIVTGFVVDDAIVVLENTHRHVEEGMAPRQAALLGAQEVGFTVLSMSCSLIAVFIPILLMGGIVGRMFREFSVTLSVAIIISLAISLTTTPMMCSRLLKRRLQAQTSWIFNLSEILVDRSRAIYGRTLTVALRHPIVVMVVLCSTVLLNVCLIISIPKGFFPEQDTGLMYGGIIGDQSISFQLMKQKMNEFVAIVRRDPAVDTVVGFTGGGGTNSGFTFVQLKPLAVRHDSIGLVIKRLRGQMSRVVGAQCWFAPGQDVSSGGRQSNSTYQYTLQADDLTALRTWGPKLKDALLDVPELVDVNSDQNEGGLETELYVDRDTAARLKLQQSQIDSTLYDCFGQRQVSTIFNPLNQYHVVMEVDPKYWQSPDTLKDIFVSEAGGAVSGTQGTNVQLGVTGSAQQNQSQNALANTGRGSASTGSAVSTTFENMVPLSAFSHFGPGTTPLQVNHQGTFAAATISFNLPIGGSLSAAVAAINHTMNLIGMPAAIHGGFQGTAKSYQGSLGDNILLLIAALLAVYVVLGILYESYIHPITILSTLPSAGVGAFLALLVFHMDFTNIAMIGVILLIGIVKKNAIMMIDVALELERHGQLHPRDAISQAALLRFRPIMMTTVVAMISALPLAIGFGEGSELRKPLGISIVGGLAVSQLLTLYTTPVVYLLLDRLRLHLRHRWNRPTEFAAEAVI
jgi:multidrug efflux pump